jgi:hypothetical protein
VIHHELSKIAVSDRTTLRGLTQFNRREVDTCL